MTPASPYVNAEPSYAATRATGTSTLVQALNLPTYTKIEAIGKGHAFF